MALISGAVHRVPLPHERGEWFEFRRLSAAQTRERKLLSLAALTAQAPEVATLDERETVESARVGLALDWTRACLTGWSYSVPFTVAAIDLLDTPTLVWASVTAFKLTHGMETGPEKNGDSPGSTATSTGNPAPIVQTPG